MKFKLEIDLGEIEGLRTGKNLAGILHGLAFTMWTATEPLHPARFGVTDPRTMATCGAWEVMPNDEEHIKRAVALQSVAPHLSMVEALEATQAQPDPNAPPTVEEWHQIADALTAYGFPTAQLEGGGAGATYIGIQLEDGRYMTLGCNADTWTADVYADWGNAFEGGDQPIESIETDAPTRDTDGTGRNHDPETIADALARATKDACIAGNSATLGRCGDPLCVCATTPQA